MKRNSTSKKPSASIITVIVIVLFGLLAGGKLFRKANPDDLHAFSQESIQQVGTPLTAITPAATSPQESTVQSVPIVPAALPAATVETKNTAANMRIIISCECPDYHHVGNEWSKYLSVNNTRVQSNDTIEMEAGADIILFTEIIEEDDAKDDIATKQETVRVTADDLARGFSVTQILRVKENGGRYSGNIAEWTVIYTFTPEK